MTQVSLFGYRGDFEEVAEAVQLAEQQGFDGFLFGEHHGAPRMTFPQSLILIAALAARTTRIKLGTSIVISPLYDPVHLAESVAMVDNLSKGRLIFGIGMGYQPQDFSHFGLRLAHRVSRFEEGIEVMRRAWADGAFSFSGSRFKYDNVSVYPKPLTRPHPPLWLAAWTIAGARRAGRLGDAYVTDPIQNLDATTQFVQAYRESAASHQRPPRVVLMREFLCAPTREEAIERYAEGLVQQYRYYWSNKAFNAELEPWVDEIASTEEITFERMAPERVIYGSPDDCIDQLEHWIKATGAEHVQLAVPASADASDAHSRSLDTIRFIGERVVPAVHDLKAVPA